MPVVQLATWDAPLEYSGRRWLADMPGFHHQAGPCDGWLHPLAPPFLLVDAVRTGAMSVERYRNVLLLQYGKFAFSHRSNLIRPGKLNASIFNPRLDVPGAHTPRQRRASDVWKRAQGSGEFTWHQAVQHGDVIVCRPGRSCALEPMSVALEQSGWDVRL